MKLVTKEQAIKNWPKWSDGTDVKIGERAISMRGPRTITGIELGAETYTLWGRTDELTEAEIEAKGLDRDKVVYNPYYIIDEGYNKFNSHPVREGEDCDFWKGDDFDAQEVAYVDFRDITERIKRVARVYGCSICDVIEKALEWA